MIYLLGNIHAAKARLNHRNNKTGNIRTPPEKIILSLLGQTIIDNFARSKVQDTNKGPFPPENAITFTRNKSTTCSHNHHHCASYII